MSMNAAQIQEKQYLTKGEPVSYLLVITIRVAMNSRMKIHILVCIVLGLGLEVWGDNGSKKCGYPAIYNFGDSNSDTGAISATFLAIHPPNGEKLLRKSIRKGLRWSTSYRFHW